MTAKCENAECPERDLLLERGGRHSFGQVFLDEPDCRECGELLTVLGGAWVT